MSDDPPATTPCSRPVRTHLGIAASAQGHPDLAMNRTKLHGEIGRADRLNRDADAAIFKTLGKAYDPSAGLGEQRVRHTGPRDMLAIGRVH